MHVHIYFNLYGVDSALFQRYVFSTELMRTRIEVVVGRSLELWDAALNNEEPSARRCGSVHSELLSFAKKFTT